MTEEWKTIEGFSRYKISPDGEVFDTKLNRLVAKQLAGIPQYYYVNVNRDDGQRKLKRVHRFVAESYVDGRSEEFDVVDHIDRDKFNNHYTNLRWVDHSGNQNNRDSNIFIFSTPVREYVQKYENPNAAYSYFTVRLRSGLSDQEIVDEYQDHLDYGLRRTIIEWEGESRYLVDLCNTFNKDYFEVGDRLRKGWDVWNAIYNISPEYPFSLEVPCELVTGHWFPSKTYLGEHFDNQGSTIQEMATTGCTYQQLESYDPLDVHRRTVLGITGTFREICSHFNKTECSVKTRMKRGYSLEDALLEKPQRIKRIVINGKADNPKNWYTSFGLNYKKVKAYKDRTKSTFEETLVHFGVDISDLDISYST